MTSPTDSDLEAAALVADGLASKIRSWKQGTQPPSGPDPTKWKLAVDEGFSAAKLDPSTWWDPYDGVPGTDGVGMRDGSLATLRNGQLIIAATRPSATSTNYDDWHSTGVAMGPAATTFGRWEFSASVTNGPGFWPCIQLWPTDDKWPAHIEFDIFESPVGNRQKAWCTTHYGSQNQQTDAEYDANFNLPHVWVVEWTPAAMTVNLDGKVVRSVTDKAQIPTTPHHWVAQTDMGSWAGTPTSKDPTRIELAVDYVKQWTYIGS